MNCPRCVVDRSQLQPLQKKTMRFFGCLKCHGLLLDRRSLESVMKNIEAQATPDELTKKEQGYFSTLVAASQFVAGGASLSCPRCKYNMYETENRSIKLDFCLNCQAIWFDNGELQEILKRLRHGEQFNLIPLPANEVDHASGLILHLLKDQFL